MRVEKDFEEFIRLLNRHKVKYLVVGAYAVAFHAQPRNTGDIDFFIKSDKGNVKRLLLVIKDFGFGSLDLKEEDFLKPEYVIQLGYEPNRIDILTSIDGVQFATAYRSKVEGKFGSESAWFISLHDLLINKQAVNRKMDAADVELLAKFRKLKSKVR